MGSGNSSFSVRFSKSWRTRANLNRHPECPRAQEDLGARRYYGNVRFATSDLAAIRYTIPVEVESGQAVQVSMRTMMSGDQSDLNCRLDVINELFGTKLQPVKFGERAKAVVDTIESTFKKIKADYDSALCGMRTMLVVVAGVAALTSKPDLRAHGVEAEYHATQRELPKLKHPSGDEDRERSEYGETVLARELWPGAMTLTEALDAVQADWISMPV